MVRKYFLALSLAIIFLAAGCEMAADQKLYLATDALRQGKLDKAIELASELLKAGNIQPQDRKRFLVGAHIVLGAAYRDKGQYDRAAEEFARAVELYPQWAGIYVERSLLYQKQQKWAQALADLVKANELDPDGAGDRMSMIHRLKVKLGQGG